MTLSGKAYTLISASGELNNAELLPEAVGACVPVALVQASPCGQNPDMPSSHVCKHPDLRSQIVF